MQQYFDFLDLAVTGLCVECELKEIDLMDFYFKKQIHKKPVNDKKSYNRPNTCFIVTLPHTKS